MAVESKSFPPLRRPRRATAPGQAPEKGLSRSRFQKALARRKRKGKESFAFKVPEFDEVAFLKREVEGAKAAMITLGYAFAVALASWTLTLVGLALVGGLLGFVALYGLRYLYPLSGIDLSRFDWKLWAGNGAIHLFAWFAFWVLLLNPPFLDVAPPLTHDAWTLPKGDPFTVGAGGTIFLTLGTDTSFQVFANVTDNQQLVDVRIRVTVDGIEQPGGPMTFTETGAVWTFTVDSAVAGNYTFVIDAIDRTGHQSSFEFIVATS